MLLASSRIDTLLARFSSLKILVLGDLMLDEFVWGKVSRISPEAPVPIVEVQQTTFYPGGSANVARNLREFTPHVSVCGVIGDDHAGRQLIGLLAEENIETAGALVVNDRSTTHKTRISAQLQQTLRQPAVTAEVPLWSYAQIVRVDHETRTAITEEARQRLLVYLQAAVPLHDAIIIEDYAKGVLDQTLIAAVIQSARDHGKILSVDPSPANPLQWNGVTVIKPNRQEAFQAAGLAISHDLKAMEKAGEILLQRWQTEYLLVTLGADGMLLMAPASPSHHAPTKAREVFDVSGAGDTAIAAFTLALAAGATGIEAAEIANHASGVVVGKLGTATLQLEELRLSLQREYA
jgi:D-glycero-beta-D-manno-heptose-7-phosphate kinase